MDIEQEINYYEEVKVIDVDEPGDVLSLAQNASKLQAL